MAEREEGEQRGFKVVDRRRFTAEGEERQGVDVPKEDPRPASPAPPAAKAASPAGQADAAKEQRPPRSEPASSEPADEELAGGLSFSVFVQSLAQQAMMQLGLIPMPHTGQRDLQLEAAQDTIDVLALLKAKTKGNLSDEEAQLLEGVLYELRMTFVQINQQLAARARNAGPGGAGPKI